MKKIELLSPAGKKESAYAAIQNGADALYMSGTKFGARAFADNFTIEEMGELIRYAHQYHVRVYITLNTLLYEDELAACEDYIHTLYEMNVDALIVQDLGILYFIRTTYPDFEVHASTQMHVYNRDALLFLKSQGVSRAVLARECSLSQIASFQDIDIEKEVFVHGALCVSFSGQCLFSAMNQGRSGNRGACAQNCRMKYTLYQDDKMIQEEAYLLSPKDLNLLDEVQEVIRLGAHSLKIEGRMKSSEYVAYVTSLYRKVMDTSYQVSEEEVKQLKVLFNRMYTKGHIFNDTDFINSEQPNHMGIRIGEVVKVGSDKIYVKLADTLHQHDGIRFLKAKIGFQVNKIYKDDLLVNHGDRGDVIALDMVSNVKQADILIKTKDVVVESAIQRTYDHYERKVKVFAKVVAKIGKPLQLHIEDEYHNEVIMVADYIVSEAMKQPTQRDEIMKRIESSGDTIYSVDCVAIDMDEHIFIPVKAIKELRRSALDKLSNQVVAQTHRKMVPFMIDKQFHGFDARGVEACVLNEVQLKACLQYPELQIYVEDRALYEQYKDSGQVHYKQSNVSVAHDPEACMVGDIGGVNQHCGLDYTLNISNSYALTYLRLLDNKQLYLSLELKDEQIEAMLANCFMKEGIGMVVYAKPKLMSSKHCVVNPNCSREDKVHCKLCKQHNYYLKDIKHQRFYVRGDDDCILHIYHHQAIDKIERIEQYQEWGISLFRLDFSDESAAEVHQIYQKFQNHYR